MSDSPTHADPHARPRVLPNGIDVWQPNYGARDDNVRVEDLQKERAGVSDGRELMEEVLADQKATECPWCGMELPHDKLKHHITKDHADEIAPPEEQESRAQQAMARRVQAETEA